MEESLRNRVISNCYELQYQKPLITLLVLDSKRPDILSCLNMVHSKMKLVQERAQAAQDIIGIIELVFERCASRDRGKDSYIEIILSQLGAWLSHEDNIQDLLVEDSGRFLKVMLKFYEQNSLQSQMNSSRTNQTLDTFCREFNRIIPHLLPKVEECEQSKEGVRTQYDLFRLSLIDLDQIKETSSSTLNSLLSLELGEGKDDKERYGRLLKNICIKLESTWTSKDYHSLIEHSKTHNL